VAGENHVFLWALRRGLVPARQVQFRRQPVCREEAITTRPAAQGRWVAVSERESIMQPGIVISGDFSAPGSPILVGPTEESLRPTATCVAAGTGAQLAAVKELGSGHRTALVIDHSFDVEHGWVTSRKTFRRVAKDAPEADPPPKYFDPDQT
jgi:hypothetical protein